MRTHYNSLKSFLVMCIMCIVGTLGTYAEDTTTKTYTYTAKTSDFRKGDFSITSGGVEWNGNTTAGYFGTDKAKGAQIGSKNNNGPLTLTTSSISGTIQSIAVNTSTSNPGNGKVNLTVSVGGKKIKEEKLTNTATEYTFTANASGDITLSWTGGYALYLKSITITYIPSSEPDPTPDPSVVTAPTFSESSKTFSNKFDLTLTKGSDAELIMYTTDGTDPSYENNNGELYESPISISHTTTIKAIAVSDAGKESDVVSETYTLELPAPTLSETSKIFKDPFTVTISANATAADGILYTLDGSKPSIDNDATEIYTEPIQISATTTLKAVSYTSNGSNNEYSPVATAVYTLQSEEQPETNVIWSEDWSNFTKDAVPTEGTNATYTCVGKGTKIYTENLAGGESPELLIGKNGGSLAVTINDLKGATNGLIFTFTANSSNRSSVIVSADNATLVSSTLVQSGDKTWVRTYIFALNEGATSLTLTLKNNSSNIRVDDLKLAKYDGLGSFNITNAGYATYYTSNAYTMPEGVTGYTVTGNEGSTLILNEAYAAKSVVPAKTALLLKGEEGKYYTIATESEKAAPADNKLHGSDATETTHVDGTDVKYYKLSYNVSGEELGFYWGSENGAAFQNAAHKAYLALDGATLLSQKRGFSIADLTQGITTGINDAVSTESAAKTIFDLNGRRVNTLRGVAKGLYIVNGKKVLVK